MWHKVGFNKNIAGFLVCFLLYTIVHAQQPIPGYAGNISDSQGGALLQGANSVFISGNYGQAMFINA